MTATPTAPPSRWLLVLTILVVVGFTVLRLIAAATLDLRSDEAYYWTWSHQWVLSFLDQPPMVAWFERAGQLIFGDTAFGARFAQLFAHRALANLADECAHDVCVDVGFQQREPNLARGYGGVSARTEEQTRPLREHRCLGERHVVDRTFRVVDAAGHEEIAHDADDESARHAVGPDANALTYRRAGLPEGPLERLIYDYHEWRPSDVGGRNPPAGLHRRTNRSQVFGRYHVEHRVRRCHRRSGNRERHVGVVAPGFHVAKARRFDTGKCRDALIRALHQCTRVDAIVGGQRNRRRY